MKHYIITRYNLKLYDRPDAEEWMRHRWRLFQRTKESILSQQGEWEWVVLVDPRTPDEWRERIGNTQTLFVAPNEWYISTRIDNDDYYLADDVFVQIQGKAQEQEMVIDIDYYQECDEVFYTSERPTPNSPFVSLVDRGDWVYKRQHTHLADGIPAVKLGVLAVMVIHDRNLANKLIGKKI